MARPAKGAAPKELSTQEKMSAFFKGSKGKQPGSKGSSSGTSTTDSPMPGAPPAPDGDTKPAAAGATLDKVERRLEKLFGGPERAPRSPVELLPPKEARLLGLRTAELTVRMKDLEWCRVQSLSLEGDVCALWDAERLRRGLIAALPVLEEAAREAQALPADDADAGDDAPLGPLLVNSQMALHHGIATLVEYIADKLVFFDLRELFVARLYFPAPAQCRLASFLHQGGALDEALTEVSAELLTHAGYAELLWAVLEHVCSNIVRAAEWCLAGPHMGAIERSSTPEDAQVVVEDVVAVRSYFTQRDEEGVSQGLGEEAVANRLARLELLANAVLSRSTAALLAAHADPRTPDDDEKEVLTRATIVRVLERRPDKEAREFCKAQKKVAKKQHGPA